MASENIIFISAVSTYLAGVLLFSTLFTTIMAVFKETRNRCFLAEALFFIIGWPLMIVIRTKPIIEYLFCGNDCVLARHVAARELARQEALRQNQTNQRIQYYLDQAEPLPATSPIRSSRFAVPLALDRGVAVNSIQLEESPVREGYAIEDLLSPLRQTGYPAFAQIAPVTELLPSPQARPI